MPQRKVQAEQSPRAGKISVIIPTLNEAPLIGTLVAHLLSRTEQVAEVIVADGGSADDTPRIAASAGARVIAAARGRGTQLNAGANKARGEIFWFLHADAVPTAANLAAIEAVFRHQAHRAAGNFKLRFAGRTKAARFMSWLYPRLRRLGLQYGDSGFFIARAAYQGMGGFADYPLFEDLDFYRRARREFAFETLGCELTVSARRFERRNFGRVFARWCLLQAGYWGGIPPRILGRYY